jgi:hypothetical protein
VDATGDTHVVKADTGVDAGSPKKDTGVDVETVKEASTADAEKDVAEKDAEKDVAEKDAEKDVAEEKDAAEEDAPTVHDGATDGSHDGAAGDAGSKDGASDAPGDAAKDGATDAHDSGAAGPLVQNYLMGRWDRSAVTMANTSSGIGAVAAWPGSGVITTFTGPNITGYLNETCNASGECDTITIEIDGVLSSAVTPAVTVTLNMAAKTGSVFTLAKGLNTITVSGIGAGTHTIGIYKNTDSENGGTFSLAQAFTPAAAGTNPTASYTFPHHIEWLGDDVTAGTGVLGTPCGANGTDATNSIEYDSYARIVSEYFNAERHNLSLPNIGVYESDPPMGYPLLGALYPLVLPSEAMSAWFPASAMNLSNPSPGYVPDLVVVNIGDYGDFDNTTGGANGVLSSVTPAGFVAGYDGALETLLKNIRTNYMTAFILVTLGPGYGGGIDPATANAVALAAVNERLMNGETAATLAFYSPGVDGATFGGCEGRPSVDDQQAFAASIEAEIKTLLNWTPATWTP